MTTGGGKGGGSPTGYSNVTQTTNTQPWSAQQPYLQQAFGGAQNLYNNYQPQYYPTSTYAPPTSMQYGGINDLNNIANSLTSGANPLLGNSSGFLNYLLAGGPQNNLNNAVLG